MPELETADHIIALYKMATPRKKRATKEECDDNKKIQRIEFLYYNDLESYNWVRREEKEETIRVL